MANFPASPLAVRGSLEFLSSFLRSLAGALDRMGANMARVGR